ncbi:MAG TPA: SDR family oxidoreductase [Candidatus Corynebacterium avicola]|uniref:SDR family oxidoreductase n=1 Tax=Candidatus Corynebacterium avicola TaxID=2838527 RepID=A0A9D1RTS5_9CORY|nr:SDR family oxidoreductase [Candidatus Corynebacterium avicola]
MSRTALVTGASGGIGREIAIDLAGNGWTVVIASRNVDGLKETAERAKGTVHVRSLDQHNESEVEALAAELEESGLTPDALINNSGVAGPSKPLWEIDTDEWDDTVAVNLRGVFLCCKAFLPAMIARGSGSIVNIGSVTGKNPLVNRSPYAASKAALIGLTKTLASDAGPHGVRANLVSPGAVGGERLEWVVKSQAEATGRSPDEIRAEASSSSALKRFADPEEVAKAVRFLASDESSGVTGIDVTVSAGFVMN